MEQPDLSLLIESALENILQKRGIMPQAAPSELSPELQAFIAQELQRQQQKQPAKVQKPLGLKWKVASIFPVERKLYKPQHIHRTQYSIPAVEKGAGPHFLEITDEEERRYMGFSRNGAGVVPAIDIAEDFVFCTTNFIMGRRNQGSPGVWIVGTLEDGKLSLERERVIMENRQASFFQEWLDDARKLASKQLFSDITDMHRLAAEYLGIKGDTWQNQEYKNTMEPCRYCQKFISKEAVKCPECGGIANIERYARMKREEEDAIAAAMGPKRKGATQSAQQETVNA